MTTQSSIADVIIVGAGLSGLLAAREVQQRGHSAILLDKGASVGGRLATRRIGSGQADHGAQFFTVRSDRFQQEVDAWLAAELLFEWARGWSDGSLHRVIPNGHPRYGVHGGMNALAKHLAVGLDVRTNVLVESVRRDAGEWQIDTAESGQFRGRALLLTAPVPQSLGLVNAGGIELPLDDLATLQSVTYAPSLTGLFLVDGPVYIPSPGAIQRAAMPVRWVADNHRKGISPGATVLTVQASPEHSRAAWDKSDDAILEDLRVGFDLFMGSQAAVREAQLKRWRFALPEVIYPESCLLIEDDAPLAFAGDAFGGPRVEGAALSGLAAGEALAAQLAGHE